MYWITNHHDAIRAGLLMMLSVAAAFTGYRTLQRSHGAAKRAFDVPVLAVLGVLVVTVLFFFH